MGHKQKILELKSQGLNQNQIRKLIGCSSATVCYHYTEGQKEKNRERGRKLEAKNHPYKSKLKRFIENKKILEKKQISQLALEKVLLRKINLFNRKRNGNDMNKITLDEVKKKLGENPRCYLTGDEIDLTKPSTYHFDHIIPRSKGGKNTIDNLGICTKAANMSKSDLTLEELTSICIKILEQRGYKVEKQ